MGSSRLLEPCAVKVACTVLRGGGDSDASSLPDKVLLVMLRATKVRIDPTAEQRQHLAKSFGCCRFAWNYALNLTNET